MLYQCCGKVFNKAVLNRRDNTVWREKLGMGEGIKLFWRTFYTINKEMWSFMMVNFTQCCGD